MNMRKVPASQGLQWIATALRLFGRHFAVFFLMGIVIMMLGQIPYLGSFIVLLLGPALTAGIVFAADQSVRGTPPRIGMLFKAFDGSHQLASFVALCLPTLALMLMLGFIAAGALMAVSGGDPAKIQSLQSDPAALIEALRTHLGAFIVVLVAGGLLNLALTLFAAPLVMLRQQGGFSAMSQSLRTVTGNLGAFAMLIVGLMVLSLLAGTVLILLATLGRTLGTWLPLVLYLFLMVLSVVFSALLMYVAWRDVFDDGSKPLEEASMVVHAEM